MKKNLLLIFLLLNSVFAFSQSGLEVKGYFGVSRTLVGPNADVVGAGSVEVDGFREIGVLLSKMIGQKARLNAGVTYVMGNAQFNPPFCGGCYWNEDYPQTRFEMVSIPVYAEYSLTKFLFVAAGPIVDFQLSDGNNFDEQSGIGYLVGLGGKVHAEKFTFSVFPNYKRHAVIPFDKPEGYKDFLQELGIQFGVGYRF